MTHKKEGVLKRKEENIRYHVSNRLNEFILNNREERYSFKSNRICLYKSRCQREIRATAGYTATAWVTK